MGDWIAIGVFALFLGGLWWFMFLRKSQR